MSKQSEHGSMISYTIGFLLSLLFTFIPYLLVVNETFSGNALWVTILGFAFAQMVIQITFFLHLGRGPKPNWNLFFFISTGAIILVVVGGSLFIMNNLHYNMSPLEKTKKIVNDEGIYQVDGKETGACQGQHDNHQIMLMNNQVSPTIVTATKCDTLTFMNHDEQVREITFAAHPDHGSYAGDMEVVVEPGKSETITLSDPGEFQFHDHIQPEVAGQFIVSE